MPAYLLLHTLCFLASACAEPTFVGVPAAIAVETDASELESNGVSTAFINVILPPSLPQDAMIEVATTLGRLISVGGTLDRKVSVRAQGGRAGVRVVGTGDTGTAYIFASGAGTVAQTTIVLSPSLPSVIDLHSDRSSAPADGATAVTITAILRRHLGAVSRGIDVRFVARDSVSQAVRDDMSGSITADSAGIARLRTTTTVTGTVEFRAYVGTVESEPRRVTLTIPPTAPAAPGE